MVYVVGIFFAVLFMGLFIALELQGRSKRTLKPGNIKELWSYAQKKTTPHLRYSALIFSATALFIFQVWESFLRFLLQRPASWIFLVAGILLLSFLLISRARAFQDMAAKDLRLGRLGFSLLFVGFSLLMNSWGTLIFVLWIFFRAFFLPMRVF